MCNTVTISPDYYYYYLNTKYEFNKLFKPDKPLNLFVISASEAKTAPVVVSTPYEQVVVNQGSNLTLECVAKGLPVPEVTWEKYGGHLVLSRCTQVLGMYNFLIHSNVFENMFKFLFIIYNFTSSHYN